tara:strand:+ start:254 stop:1123 length:870 start_codon:yes stop_codon:yes gene_type:complete
MSKLMRGKTVVITGATSGIGYYSALEIANLGAHVILVGRNSERGKSAVESITKESGNPEIEFIMGDVSTKKGVSQLADCIDQSVSKIDVLINNAGYLGNTLKYNKDGLEMHFAVNVVAPWNLAHALLPKLKSSLSPRVLNISGGDKPAAIVPTNLQAEKKFRGLMTYTHSKSILEGMSIALSKRLESENVSVNIVFPGRASTLMTQSLTTKGLPGPMKIMMPFFKLFFRSDGGKSAHKASQSTVFVATDSSLEGVTGRYFDTKSNEQELHSSAYDEHIQKQIIDAIECS